MKDDLEPLSSELSIADLTDADDTDSKHSDNAGFEEDVLPFLLQAQDIVMKLESRVIELEEDLFVSNESKYNNYKFLILTSFHIRRPFIPNMNTIGQIG
jgi:hypothetical protein